jgi:hypothetical protein
MKTTFHSLLLLILFSTMATAQTEVKSNKSCGGFGYFSFSGEQLHLTDLNHSLTANGYSSFNTIGTSYGGGGYFVINNFMIGGGGSWLADSRRKNPGSSQHLKGGYGCFSIGYLIYSGKRSLFYPTIGLGGGGYDMIVSKNSSSPDFTQQLNTPSGTLSANAGGWMSNIQLNYQCFFSKAGTEGFFIGLRAGYKYSPYDWSVGIDNNKLNNAPGINMNGFYASIILGGGSVFK